MTPPKRNVTKALSLNRARAKCATWSAGSENRPTMALEKISYMLIGFSQQPPQFPQLSKLSDTKCYILVSSKQREGNQYGSSGTDYICGFPETVQD